MPACSKPNNDIITEPKRTTAEEVLLARIGAHRVAKPHAHTPELTIPIINTVVLKTVAEAQSTIRDLEKLQSRKGVDPKKVARELSRLRARLLELQQSERKDRTNERAVNGRLATGVVRAISTERHCVLRSELDQLRAGGGTNKEVGDFSEAVVAGLEVVSGRALLQQHNPGDKPQGLDIQSVDATGKVWAIEVKGTRSAGKRPSGDRYTVGRQGSQAYVHDRSQDSPVNTSLAAAVGPGSDQMGSVLIQVNVTDGEVTVWELDGAGKRTGTSPLEVWSLDDLVEVIDQS